MLELTEILQTLELVLRRWMENVPVIMVIREPVSSKLENHHGGRNQRKFESELVA